MTDKRVWPVRAMYMLVAAALVISLVFTAAPASPAVAADNDVRAEWERVPTPTTAGWVLAPESTIIDYAVADEGEVAYAIVEQDGDSYLLKSTTHAATWHAITGRLGTFEDEVVRLLRVATDGDDADFLAVAADIDGDVFVHVSNDGGTTFTSTAVNGLDPHSVSDLAVSPLVGTTRNLAIGGQVAGVATVFRSRVVNGDAAPWTNVSTGGWRASIYVTDIEFSPNWSADRTVLVTTVEHGAPHNVYLQSGTWDTIVGWNMESDLAIAGVLVAENVDMPVLLADRDARLLAGMAIPTHGANLYDSRNPGARILWVWVNHLVEGEARNEIVRVANVDAGTAGPMSSIEGGRAWLTGISYRGDIDSGKALAGLLGTGRATNGDLTLTDFCAGVAVYRNFDIANMIICCIPWSRACKLPTGRGAMAVSYVNETKGYAVALGEVHPYDESAWSWSFDDGDNWNQLSLIDTHIDYLSDVAVSPDCNKTMLVSVNLDHGSLCDSVWLHAEELPEASEYSGRWIRTWARQLIGDNEGHFPNFPERGLLRLNPDEITGHVVYLLDRMSGRVYRDDLEGLGCWERTTSILDIVDLAVRDADTIFALGADGRIAKFNGDAWTTPVATGVHAGWTIAVWNDDIIVGGQGGRVALSDDGGETFTSVQRIPTPITPAPPHRLVTVAFDTYFGENDTIFAAVAELDDEHTPVGGDIWMWTIEESTRWINLLARPSTFQLTGGGNQHDSNRVAYTGLVLDDADGNPMTDPQTGGVLYASYIGLHPVFVKDDSVDFYLTGAARALTPLMEVDDCVECPVEWDYLIWTEDGRILDDELFAMAPQALKICGCLTPNTYTKIFAIGGHHDGYDMDDAEFGTVWMFEDCYSKVAVDLRQPEDGFVVPADPCECENEPFIVIWDRVCDACKYEIQIASDPDFAFTVLEIPPMLTSAEDPHATIGRVLVPGRTYYWRVRAREAGTGQQIRSWWSEGRSLAVAPAPGTGVSPSTPALGATDVRITDVPFSWTAVEGADSYNWELSRNADFDPTVATATGLETTSYLYTGELNYDTTYFWRVTAIQDGSPVSHTVGSFTTRPEPQYCHPQTGVCFDTEEELRQYSEDLLERPTPTWVWVLIAIGAVLVIVVIVLIFRTRRV